MMMIDCRFKGHGFENMGTGKTPKDVIEGFKKSPLHNEVMLNNGPWVKNPLGQQKYWGSVGAAFLRDPSRNDSKLWHLAPLWFAWEQDNSTC